MDEHVERLTTDDTPDLVVIQVYITNAYRAYRLADSYRARGSFVALGGLHVTSLPEEEPAPHADAIFLGPGEQTFPHLKKFSRRAARAALRVDQWAHRAFDRRRASADRGHRHGISYIRTESRTVLSLLVDHIHRQSPGCTCLSARGHRQRRRASGKAVIARVEVETTGPLRVVVRMDGLIGRGGRSNTRPYRACSLLRRFLHRPASGDRRKS